jgi:hypothetical protein
VGVATHREMRTVSRLAFRKTKCSAVWFSLFCDCPGIARDAVEGRTPAAITTLAGLFRDFELFYGASEKGELWRECVLLVRA